MSMNLPCRVTSSTRLPASADSGGSNVFSALKAAMSTRAIARPCEPAAQVEREAFDLGQLGHAPSVGGDTRCRGADKPGRRGATLEPCSRSRPLPAAGEVFLDARGAGRALRVSWHAEADVVVLSLWQRRHLQRARSGSRSRTSPT